MRSNSPVKATFHLEWLLSQISPLFPLQELFLQLSHFPLLSYRACQVSRFFLGFCSLFSDAQLCFSWPILTWIKFALLVNRSHAPSSFLLVLTPTFQSVLHQFEWPLRLSLTDIQCEVTQVTCVWHSFESAWVSLLALAWCPCRLSTSESLIVLYTGLVI